MKLDKALKLADPKRKLREAMRKTEAGRLAEAIEEMLYGGDTANTRTCDVKGKPNSQAMRRYVIPDTIRYREKPWGESRRGPTEDALREVKEYLEARALGEAWPG